MFDKLGEYFRRSLTPDSCNSPSPLRRRTLRNSHRGDIDLHSARSYDPKRSKKLIKVDHVTPESSFDFISPKPGKDYELKKMYDWKDPTD
jgi:hypothetical protein